jgi:hypothetical protein
MKKTSEKIEQPVHSEGVTLRESEEANVKLREANRLLQTKVREAEDSLARFRLELIERNGIIDKLLSILDKKRENPQDPGMPRTTIS